MKVLGFYKIKALSIETEDGDTYIRYARNCWYKTEAVGDVPFDDDEEIEEAYQNFISMGGLETEID